MIARVPAPPHDEGQFYCIRARGRLDEFWAQRLPWMLVAHEVDGGRPITVLTGRVPDQSALVGIVNTLADLGMELLLVDATEPDAPHTITRRAS